MKCFYNDLVYDMGSVHIRGVDVIDSASHCLAQHGNRSLRIIRRAPRVQACESHSAVAHPADRSGTARD